MQYANLRPTSNGSFLSKKIVIFIILKSQIEKIYIFMPISKNEKKNNFHLRDTLNFPLRDLAQVTGEREKTCVLIKLLQVYTRFES